MLQSRCLRLRYWAFLFFARHPTPYGFLESSLIIIQQEQLIFEFYEARTYIIQLFSVPRVDHLSSLVYSEAPSQLLEKHASPNAGSNTSKLNNILEHDLLYTASATAGNLSYDCARGRHRTVSAAASRRHVDALWIRLQEKSPRS